MGDMMERFLESTRNYYQPQNMVGNSTDFMAIGVNSVPQGYTNPYGNLGSMWGTKFCLSICFEWFLIFNFIQTVIS